MLRKQGDSSVGKVCALQAQGPGVWPPEPTVKSKSWEGRGERSPGDLCPHGPAYLEMSRSARGLVLKIKVADSSGHSGSSSNLHIHASVHMQPHTHKIACTHSTCAHTQEKEAGMTGLSVVALYCLTVHSASHYLDAVDQSCLVLGIIIV